MRIVIAGAGNVGRSIARELIANGHQVLLVDRDPKAIRTESVPRAEWLLADACELDTLTEARLDTCDVCIAATGDDKANLVHSLLAKTEFGVPRTVGRVNHPENEWMFDDVWGVDVAVSTPRIMSALVEEAVSIGDLVRIFTFQSGSANLVELTLPAESPRVGQLLRDITLPGDAVLVAMIRGGRALTPDPSRALQESDELLFVVSPEHERALAQLLSPNQSL
ncbi:potassium channel family protein [Luteococcus sp. OSA5]|uniref:potassium channel family protein n=1 Tax=Luteococcus sp. OSA5 TaxID=3401630 RepID=UPI003B42DB9E